MPSASRESGRPWPGPGGLYAAPEVEAADARAGDALTAVWREHRDVAAEAQLRMFLDVLDPSLPATLDPGRSTKSPVSTRSRL